MASALDQLLRPGERIIYRTPRPWPPRYQRWHGLTFLALGLGYLAIDEWTAFDWGSLMTPRLIGWLFVGIIVLAVNFAERCKIQVAVTNRRLLRVGPHGPQLETRDIDLAEVAVVEWRPGAVRLTNRNGEIFTVDHPSHAPEIALAAAQASGRPPPWVPGFKESIATYASLCLGIGGYLGLVKLQVWALASADLIPIPAPQCLLLVVLVFSVAALGWLAMEPFTLIALRPFWRKDEARAWLRYYLPVLEDPAESAALQRFSQWRRRYFSLVAALLYGQEITTANDGAGGHGA